jgi:hypothetical protein
MVEGLQTELSMHERSAGEEPQDGLIPDAVKKHVSDLIKSTADVS